MIQVWCYDKNGFFTESIFIENIEENMTEIPIAYGFYKAKWNGDEWIEGGSPNLDKIKESKINHLNQKCNETIINGFYSDADGTKKLYDFELENQVNLSTKAYQLQIAKLAGQPITTVSYYAKGETCHDYTADQFLKLAQDGETWKTSNIQKYKDILKPKVLACTTVDEVNAITWDSVSV